MPGPDSSYSSLEIHMDWKVDREARMEPPIHTDLGVEGGLGEQDGVLLGGDTEFIVEGVVPDLLHVIPVGDDTVLDGVLQGEDTSLGLGLVADVAVLLSHTDHDTLVTGATDDGGEDGAGSVVTGEAGLAHAGAIVDYESSNIVVTHLGWVPSESDTT
ncbi:hypothetical protein FOCC_FOCC007081 [Frankliniella occidentalis]|nr:hypothetical protein FOCC_FOCC007081 [Frankliniella occidentalis]